MIARTALSAVGGILLLSYLAVVGYAVARPGCSLLPVNPPASDQELPGTESEACAALGQPMPRPHYLPSGFRQLGRGVSAPHPLGPDRPEWVGVATRGTVHISYGRTAASMALAAMPGAWPTYNAPTSTIEGRPALINDRTLPDGRRDRAYMWVRDGLILTMHIALSEGVTAEIADRIAGSTW
jgi:hypothetical protein